MVDNALIERLYFVEKRSVTSIAEELGMSRDAVDLILCEMVSKLISDLDND